MQTINQILAQNIGNRITTELANGLAHAIGQAVAEREKALRAEIENTQTPAKPNGKKPVTGAA